MTANLSRRGFLGAAAVLAAPAIIRPGVLMPVRAAVLPPPRMECFGVDWRLSADELALPPSKFSGRILRPGLRKLAQALIEKDVPANLVRVAYRLLPDNQFDVGLTGLSLTVYASEEAADAFVPGGVPPGERASPFVVAALRCAMAEERRDRALLNAARRNLPAPSDA